MSTPHTGTGNRLQFEQSPYLQQHAQNPVDWYPWGAEALAKSRVENKPILLSIGYSTCHWCHVMEHDTFENTDAARVMNELFVNIKVDREEHPDLDGIYMQASQALTGYGGWPLNVWLTPDLVPFYSGGYMPPYAQGSHPGFIQLCQILHMQFTEQRERVDEIGARITEALTHRPDQLAGGLPASVMSQVHNYCQATYDRLLGGFGRPPKFPPAMLLTLLLRDARLTDSTVVMEMVEHTLRAMAQGGIFDQVGGGFHRYSTDAQWLVPHFEKMLYDNALLARAYTEAWQLTSRPFYRQIASETLEYVLRDMAHPEGPFFSAEDADSLPPGSPGGSHKEEGAFYTFSLTEFAEALGTELPVELLREYWDVTERGNFEGKNILHTPIFQEKFISGHQLDAAGWLQTVRSAKERLRAFREQRERPHLDDKILTSWNGLMIGSLASAGIAFGESRYVTAAERAAAFVLTHLRQPDGRLLRRWRSGDGRLAGTLEDYAWLAYGLMELYEATLTPSYLNEAVALAQYIATHFADPAGGFFLTEEGTADLLVRPKELFDNATPSGNSVAAYVCARLWAMTGDAAWRDLAQGAINAAGEFVLRAPSAFGWLLQAWQFLHAPPIEIVVSGPLDDPATQELLTTARSFYLPHRVLLHATPEFATHFPLIAARPSVEGMPAAYVCREQACQAPVTSAEALFRLLQAPQTA